MSLLLDRPPVLDDVSRRRLLAGGAGIALLAGCGAPSTAPVPAAGPGFPRTITHGFGTTVVPARPQRVVVVGYCEADIAVALGTVPVAMRSVSFPGIDGTTPWLVSALGSARPEMLALGETLNIEQVAALAPDLILAGTLSTIATDYPLLSRVAPTIPWTRGYYQDPWQEQTRTVGAALGADVAAERLVAAVEAQVAAVVARHPAWAGRTFAVALYTGDGSFAVTVSGADPTYQLYADLGLTSTPALAQLGRAGDGTGGGSSASLAMENIGLLDVDVLLLSAVSPEADAALRADPLFRGLRVAAENRVVAVPMVSAYGQRFPGPLSVPYLLGGLEAPIAAALGA